MNEQRRVLSNYRDRGSVIASVILQRHHPIIIIFIIIQIIVTIVSSPTPSPHRQHCKSLQQTLFSFHPRQEEAGGDAGRGDN